MCRVGASAFALSHVYILLTPSIGLCLLPLIRIGRRDAGSLKDGGHDVDDVVELATDPAQVRNVARPGHGDTLSCSTEVRRHLLHPLERRIHRPDPKFGGVIKEKASESTAWWPPRVVPPKDMLRLNFTIECSHRL